MSTDKQAEQKALLQELESIKSLLLEEMDSMAAQELDGLNIAADDHTNINTDSAMVAFETEFPTDAPITSPPVLDDDFEDFNIPLLDPDSAIENDVESDTEKSIDHKINSTADSTVPEDAHLDIPLLEMPPEQVINTVSDTPRHKENKTSQQNLFDRPHRQNTLENSAPTTSNGSDSSSGTPDDILLNNNTLLHDDPTEHHKTQNVASSQRVTANGENPFLPQHIRDRLHGNRMAIKEAKTQQTKSVQTQKNQSRKQHSNIDKHNPDQILDQLIAEFIPQIEAKLRLQLQPILEQQLQTTVQNTNDNNSE